MHKASIGSVKQGFSRSFQDMAVACEGSERSLLLSPFWDTGLECTRQCRIALAVPRILCGTLQRCSKTNAGSERHIFLSFPYHSACDLKAARVRLERHRFRRTFQLMVVSRKWQAYDWCTCVLTTFKNILLWRTSDKHRFAKAVIKQSFFVLRQCL